MYKREKIEMKGIVQGMWGINRTGRETTRARGERKGEEKRKKGDRKRAGPTVLEILDGARNECVTAYETAVFGPLSSVWSFRSTCCY